MWPQMCIGRHVKCGLFLFDFNDFCIFSADVRKIVKSKYFMKFRLLGAELCVGRRTDGHDDDNSRFSQFCGRAYKPVSQCCLGK